MKLAAEIVEWDVMFRMIYSSIAAGVGVAFAFSVAVAGSTRFADEVREGRRTRAAMFGVLAVVGLLACLAAIVLGIVVMTSKD